MKPYSNIMIPVMMMVIMLIQLEFQKYHQHRQARYPIHQSWIWM